MTNIFARISRTKAWKYPLENKGIREKTLRQSEFERLNAS